MSRKCFFLWNCVCPGTMFVQKLCLTRNCVCPGTLFVQELCLSRNYVGSETVFDQELCLSRNCVFGWDEESCAGDGSAIPLDFSESHIILILIILILIMVGKSFFFVNHKCHFPLTHVYTKHKSLCILNI